MSQPSRENNPPPPPLVALVAWLIPGAGYWMLGQRARALTTGITIVALFAFGLLIGGVRALEVPGWDDDGTKVRVNARGEKVKPDYGYAYTQAKWVMTRNPLIELRAKPWSIAQVLAGPVAMAGSAWSVWASTDPDGPDGSAEPPGATSHSRINEIGVLYTAVAGMLNLLTIIDASHRAAQGHSQPHAHPHPAVPQARPEAR